MAIAEISLYPSNYIGSGPRGQGVEPPVRVSGKLAPHFSQKGKVKAKKICLCGPDVVRGPYVAPSWFRGTDFYANQGNLLTKLAQGTLRFFSELTLAFRHPWIKIIFLLQYVCKMSNL